MSIEINREKLKKAVKAVKVGSAALFGLSALGGAAGPAEASSSGDSALDKRNSITTINGQVPDYSVPGVNLPNPEVASIKHLGGGRQEPKVSIPVHLRAAGIAYGDARPGVAIQTILPASLSKNLLSDFLRESF